MKHKTEKEIRKIIGTLVKNKAYTTTEMKRKIASRKMSEGDMERLPNGETYRLMKIIGNVVSHQSDPVVRYDEGFTCIKSVRPALFVSNSYGLTEA